MGLGSSVGKKVKTIVKNGFKPIEQGSYNFKHPAKEIESIAKQRAKVCENCPFMELEPAKIWRIKDERIPAISEQYCTECGCELPYKVRQNLEKCQKWKQ